MTTYCDFDAITISPNKTHQVFCVSAWVYYYYDGINIYLAPFATTTTTTTTITTTTTTDYYQ